MAQLLQSWEACVLVRDLLDVKGRNHLSKTVLQSSMDIYRPQTKFAKVMFLHLSVSHTVHRGMSASVYAGIHTPPWRPNPGGDTP